MGYPAAGLAPPITPAAADLPEGVGDNTAHLGSPVPTQNSVSTGAPVLTSGLPAPGATTATPAPTPQPAVNVVAPTEDLRDRPPVLLQNAASAQVDPSLAAKVADGGIDPSVAANVAKLYPSANIDPNDPHAVAPFAIKSAEAGFQAVTGRPPTPAETQAGFAAISNERGAAENMKGFLGANEVANHDQLDAYIHQGGINLDPRQQPWCAAFVNAALAHAGVKGTGTAWAPDFLKWGQPVANNDVREGDVLVANNGHHVGLVAEDGVKDGMVHLIAGNENDRNFSPAPGRSQAGMVNDRWVPLSEFTVRRATEGTAPAGAPATPTNDYVPFTNPILQSDRQADAVSKANSGSSFVAQAYEANRQNGLSSNIFRDYTYATIPEQPGYTATPDMVRADPRLSSIDPNEAASLEDSRSPAEYEKRISDLQDDMAYQTRVANSGVKGWLATQVGTLLDPANLALGAITGGETLAGKVIAQGAISGASALYDQRRASELNYLSIGVSTALGAGVGAGMHLASTGIHPTLKRSLMDIQDSAGDYAKAVQAKLAGKSEQEAMEVGNSRAAHATEAPNVVNGEVAAPSVTNFDHDDYGMMVNEQARKLAPAEFEQAESLSDKIDWAKANPSEEATVNTAALEAQREKLLPKIQEAVRTVNDNLQTANIRPAEVGAAVPNTEREVLHPSTVNWLSNAVNDATARRVDTSDKLGKLGNMYNTGYLLRDDSNPAVRAVGKVGVVNYAGAGDGVPATREVATETKRTLVKTFLARSEEHANAKYTAWYKEQRAQGVPAKLRTRDAFSKQVSDAIEEQNPSVRAGIDKHILADADNKAKLYQEMAGHLNDPSMGDGQIFDPVKGAAPPDKNYNPHQYDFDAINEFENQFGSKTAKGFISDAVRRGPLGQAIKDPEALEKVAQGFADRLLSAREQSALGNSNILEDSDLKALPKLLRRAGVEDPEIEKVMNMFSAMKEGDDGEIARLKSKTPLLVSHADNLRDINGRTIPVKFTDLMERNADTLMRQYVGATSGQIALKRMRFDDPNTGEHLIDGLDERSKQQALMKSIHDIDAQNGVPMKETKDKIQRVQWVLDHIAGRMQDADKGNIAAGARILRNYAMSVFMGKTGIMHIAQFSRAFSEQGVKAFTNAMPILFKLGRDAESGKLRSELAQTAQEMTGAGTDWIRGKMMTGPTDEMGNSLSSGLQTAEHWSQQGARKMSALSFMAPVMSALQRMSVLGAVSKFAQDATGERLINLNKLTQLGMDRPMADRIAKMMQQNAGFNPESKVKWGADARMTRLNEQQWSDKEAARAFSVAVNRWGSQIANEHDIGQMASIMGSTGGKLMSQFRSFAMGAHTNYLLNAVNNPNKTTAMSVLVGCGLSYLGYWARQQASTAGMSDQDAQKYLHDPKSGRLNPGMSFAGMVHGSGYASFVPAIADAALMLTDHHPFFDVRSTEIAQTSAPALDLFNQGARAVKGISHLVRTGEYSQADGKALLRVMPFASSWAGTALSNEWLRTLPKTDHVK